MFRRRSQLFWTNPNLNIGLRSTWNAIVRGSLPVSAVQLESDTQRLTITFPAYPLYEIESPETITFTLPASATASGNRIFVSPSFRGDPIGFWRDSSRSTDSFFADADVSSRTLKRMVREAQLAQYNYILVVGGQGVQVERVRHHQFGQAAGIALLLPRQAAGPQRVEIARQQRLRRVLSAADRHRGGEGGRGGARITHALARAQGASLTYATATGRLASAADSRSA